MNCSQSIRILRSEKAGEIRSEAACMPQRHAARLSGKGMSLCIATVSQWFFYRMME